MVTWERGFEWLGFLRWFQKMTFVGENDVCIYNTYINIIIDIRIYILQAFC